MYVSFGSLGVSYEYTTYPEKKLLVFQSLVMGKWLSSFTNLGERTGPDHFQSQVLVKSRV